MVASILKNGTGRSAILQKINTAVAVFWRVFRKCSQQLLILNIDFSAPFKFFSGHFIDATYRNKISWMSWEKIYVGIFKTCVRNILFFYQMIALEFNFKKCSLFHLKSPFHSRDIKIFVFLSYPLFFAVGHCFRGWGQKTNTLVYGNAGDAKNLHPGGRKIFFI